MEPKRTDFSTILDLIEGSLPEEEVQAIIMQMETGDEETRANLIWLRNFLQISRKVQLVTPPPEIREILTKYFTEHHKKGQLLNDAPPTATLQSDTPV